MESLLRSPLDAFHRAAGARLVAFAGWEMPLLYRGIVEEHLYTRAHASLFDVSHMGRVEFRGPDAAPLLERLCTRAIGTMAAGQCRYSHVCRDDGGILDDVIVSRFEDRFLVVCNAANRAKLLAWFERQRAAFDVLVVDRTVETAMVAVQGPEAIETFDRLLGADAASLKRYHFRSGSAFGAEYYVARSGYTGEDGVEIILPAHLAVAAADALLERSTALGRPVRPAGLGARDTLRLEAGMPLYGHELSEDWDSITAGQAWCVDLSKDFIGRDALERVRRDGPRRTVAGLELDGRRVARPPASVRRHGRDVGVVTSGAHCPTFDRPLAMALIEAGSASAGTALEVDVRGTAATARVVPLPFYKRR